MTNNDPQVVVGVRMPKSMLEALRREAVSLSKKTALSATVSDIIRAYIRASLPNGKRR
jgi:hypothetical protein